MDDLLSDVMAEIRDSTSLNLHISLRVRMLEQIAGADDFVAPLLEGDIKLTMPL